MTNMVAIIGGVFGLLVLATISLFVGVIDFSVADLLSGNGLDLLVISRLPRTLAAIIAGAALAVCGTIIQLLVRNKFVEPMTAGTGQGAMVGILFVSVFLPHIPIIFQISIAAIAAMITSIGLLLIVSATAAFATALCCACRLYIWRRHRSGRHLPRPSI